MVLSGSPFHPCMRGSRSTTTPVKLARIAETTAAATGQNHGKVKPRFAADPPIEVNASIQRIASESKKLQTDVVQ